ncbi:MAG: Gfo/Idh/MocA family oxidoreductase [Dehalococcoidia bacterium]|nr:Gfo/Idh/MocA family oxidoreductase [Dehalococcoidia bacterium]
MSKLRIGFIGAGGNTRSRHIPGFLELDDIELAGVANRTRESSQAVADEFAIERVYDSPAELIADAAIDAVCIGTWPYRHRDYTVAALAAGKHVLCEARMAMDAAEAAEMLDASERRPHLVAQLVPAPFDLKSGATITRLLEEGAIGEVREVAVVALNGSALDPATPVHWRQQTRYSGRNIHSLGIWSEVVQRWLGEARTVMAHGSTFVPERMDPATGESTPVEVPDTVAVAGSLMNGAAYTYRVSNVAAGTHQNGITVFGTKGVIQWLPNDTASLTTDGEEAQPIVPDSGTARGWRVEADFVTSIREGAPVRFTSFPDGLRYMRFIDAAWRSLQDGCAVEVQAGSGTNQG